MSEELNYINDWIKQDEHSLLDISNCSCVLVKFKDKFKGITTDDDSTVAISWIREGEQVLTEEGEFHIDEIAEWKAI